MAVREGLRDALADRYALERELGRGGMAIVYLARDLRHDRPVALKVLLPELAAALGPERFQREIRLAARLQHPHILTVHDSGEAAGAEDAQRHVILGLALAHLGRKADAVREGERGAALAPIGKGATLGPYVRH